MQEIIKTVLSFATIFSLLISIVQLAKKHRTVSDYYLCLVGLSATGIIGLAYLNFHPLFPGRVLLEYDLHCGQK